MIKFEGRRIRAIVNVNEDVGDGAAMLSKRSEVKNPRYIYMNLPKI